MTDDALLIESIERKKLTDERKRTQYARAYVKKGAQHLDLHMPDWASRINVDIDPQTECARIIEQLYDKYQDGHDALGLKGHDEFRMGYRCSSHTRMRDLREAWRREIARRVK